MRLLNKNHTACPGLHATERTKQLGEALGEVLETERQTSRQVNALYEISRSFAQSLSLDKTLATVTSTIGTSCIGSVTSSSPLRR